MQINHDLIASFKPTVLFQPIYNCCSKLIIGAETLFRLKDKNHGDMVPPTYLESLNKNPLIIDSYVAKLLLAHVMVSGIGDVTFISVNINHSSLDDSIKPGSIIDCLIRLHQHLFTMGKYLVVELIEYTAHNYRHNRVIDQLRTLGIKFAIDDFGEGYNKPEYLNTLTKIDIVKVCYDSSCVTKIEDLIDQVYILFPYINRESIFVEYIDTHIKAEHMLKAGLLIHQGYLYGDAIASTNFN